MLDGHPELAMPRETRFVLGAWRRRERFGDLRKEENRRSLARWIFERPRARADRLNVDPKEAIERLTAAPPTLGSILGTAFVLHAEGEGKPRWGDKRPTYAARMSAVWALFPNAVFVNVIRDPRGCVASMKRLGWWGGNVVRAVDLWDRSVRAVEAWRPRLGPDQLLDVRYEDLVADAPCVLGEIAGFAGLDAGEAALASMLRYSERSESLNVVFHPNVARPPDTTRVAAWHDELSEREIAFVEHALGPAMTSLGYELAREGAPPPAKMLARLEGRRERRREASRRAKPGSRTGRFRRRRPVAAEPDAIRVHPRERLAAPGGTSAAG